MFYQNWHKKTVDLLTPTAINYPFQSKNENVSNFQSQEDIEHKPIGNLLQTYNSILDGEERLVENQSEQSSTSNWGQLFSKNKDNERIMALQKCMNRLIILQESQGKCKNSLNDLEAKYCSVAEKTSSLHNACDQLMSQQTQLAAANEQIKANLHHYQQYEWLMKKLQTSKLSLSGTLFTQILSTLHECITYLKSHRDEKEAEVYLKKYEQCLSKSLTAIKAGVLSDLESCKDDVLYRQSRAGHNPQHPAIGTADTTNTTSFSGPSSSYVDDDTFALLYGVFGVKANTVRNAISQAHQFFADCLEYQTVVLELEHEYLQIREHLLRPIVNVTIQQLCQRHSNSSCTLTRDGCSFLLRLCDDEFRLYKQFFVISPLDAGSQMGTRSSVTSAVPMSEDVQYFWQQSCRSFNGFIEGLCRILYDTLRPIIIHNPHLETLAQLCSLLKVEMIEDRCGMLMSFPSGLPGSSTTGMNTPRFGDTGQGALVHRKMSTMSEAAASEFLANPRAGFARVMGELVGDIVERIVYRTSLFAQSDVLGYTPAPGDLAYPERLVMMKDINATEMAANTIEGLENEAGKTSKAGNANNSAAAIDLHCLWYPTVRRTVMCLSKLYKCLDQAVFLSISRELLDACCQSLEIAAQKIRTLPIKPAKASVKSAGRSLDAELFIVKHLLILREQTSPYRITSKKSYRGSNASLSRSNSIGNVAVEAVQTAVAPQFDYSLDLSMYKNNIFTLWNAENRGRWFELSSNNAFLSFLLAAPVHVSELQTDSRRIIEGHLKRYCHDLIRFVTNLLVGGELQKLSEIADYYENNNQQEPSGIQQQQQTIHVLQKPEQLSPKAIHDCVSLAFKNLRQNWPSVRSAFSLYIGVKETEEILLQPIRKAVVNLFTNISLYTQKHCTEEQRQVACVPNQEQIWLLLNA